MTMMVAAGSRKAAGGRKKATTKPERARKTTRRDRKKKYDPDSLVERVIAKVGQPVLLARMLTVMSGKTVSRQTVNNWRNRGFFPAGEILVHIKKLSNIPIEELLKRPKDENDNGD